MNQEQQRIAIAEACGWRIKSDGHCTFVYDTGKNIGTGYRVNDIRHPKIIALLPDYLNDLNAMNEAINSLKWSKHISFLFTLNEIGVNGEWDILTASPAKLAEAFLRTLDLWTESE